MTDFCNIPEGFHHKCAVQVEPTPHDISAKLTSLFQLSDMELMKIGKRGKELVSKSFTWEVIAKQTVELYHYLLGKGSKPSFVYED